MSGERLIDRADLGKIEAGLSNLNVQVATLSHHVSVVDHNVQVVNQQVAGTQQKLDDLTREFQEFVRHDQLFKELQLAETRLVKIRQEIETSFGHYSEVRRRVTGILQAVDVKLVKKETIENMTEEHMLAAPRYWLAPCLIALAAWLNENKELAERAMMEALKRDDEKTSLFFALVTRRGARYKASRQWLDRYFGLQDPHELEREMIILVDGFTNGIFGAEARTQIGKRIQGWIDELSQKAGFVEEQGKQWRVALEAKIKKLDDDKYPLLRGYSSTWPDLEHSLKGAKLHGTIHDFFQEIFNREAVPHVSIAIAVDAMLDTLVSKFDEEELPLRREERLQTLIVEEEGDRDAAKSRFSAEKTLEERVSFTQLLTNFAMYPEVSQASAATQKYAIALSKDWIRQAHDDLTLDNRMNVPQKIQIEIDDWQGITELGDNEAELLEDLTLHVEVLRDSQLEKFKLRLKHWAGLVAGVFFTLVGFASPPLFILGACGILYFFAAKRQLKKTKVKIADNYQEMLHNFSEILRAVLSDVVDWRKEYESDDSKAIKVTELIESASPEQFVFNNYDTARGVLRS